MAAPVLLCLLEIGLRWKKALIEYRQMRFSRSVEGRTRRCRLCNGDVPRVLKIFNIHDSITKNKQIWVAWLITGWQAVQEGLEKRWMKTVNSFGSGIGLLFMCLQFEFPVPFFLITNCNQNPSSESECSRLKSRNHKESERGDFTVKPSQGAVFRLPSCPTLRHRPASVTVV